LTVTASAAVSRAAVSSDSGASAYAAGAAVADSTAPGPAVAAAAAAAGAAGDSEASPAAVEGRLQDNLPFSSAPWNGSPGPSGGQGMADIPQGVGESEEGGMMSERMQRWWPRFAVVVEGVQMETVSMAQHVGTVYVPEYIVDSADASLTLCFLPVWGHALVNTIEVLPVPASFYLLPPIVPPNAFLALRARIDCGRAPTNGSAGSNSSSTDGSTNRLAASGGAVPAEPASASTWSFNASVASTELVPLRNGTRLVDPLGRLWSSDLNQIVQTQQVGSSPAAGEPAHEAESGKQREKQWRVKPPKSISTVVPVNGDGESPFFLSQALLQTSREAVLASGLHYSFSFRIPARLNRWVVLLHFVALQPESRVGERVFDIHVNGVTVRGFDILREAKGLHNRLVTLPVVVGFSRPAIGSAPTLEVQLVARNGSKFSPLVSSIEVIEVVRANVPRENVISELKAQQSGDPKEARPPASSHSSYAGVVAGAIGGAGALVLLVMLVPLVLLWRRQHRRRHAMRSQLLGPGVLDSTAAEIVDLEVRTSEELGLVEIVEEI
ncbi:hypothetical protein CLOM_g22875, partial [Closterium sp. NIES-68]